MTTVIGILDKETWQSRTDINVVIQPERKTLTWIPRDLYAPPIQNRINAAFKRGGHGVYQQMVTEAGFPVQHSVVFTRTATNIGLNRTTIRVPVKERMVFIHPGTKKVIAVFNPPAEVLPKKQFGTIHHWIGSRYRDPPARLPDIDRCLRQMILVQEMLRHGKDFSIFLINGLYSMSDERALWDAQKVEVDWRFELFDGFKGRMMNGMSVLYPLRWNGKKVDSPVQN